MSPIEGTPSVEPKNSEVDKNPGVVSRMAHSALSKENFVGMGVGFAAREALKTIVGGPIIAPVIGTVSAVASGIAREAQRAEKIDNFSDYLRYQRGEITYEKLTAEQKKRIKEHEERMGIMRATPLPKRIFEGVKSVVRAVGQKVEEATGVGKKIDEKMKEVKTRIVQTTGFTDISHRLDKLGKNITQGVAKAIQTKAAQSVIHTARHVDEKVKDIATGQSRRLDRLDKATVTAEAQDKKSINREKIRTISKIIRERINKKEVITPDEVKNMLGTGMTEAELESVISKLEKVATDAFIAHAVAAQGQKRGEKDVRGDTMALAKDAIRIIKVLKGENADKQVIKDSNIEAEPEKKKYSTLRKHISREAKSVVTRSVIAAGLKRAALAPITSLIGSEVSAALRPTINTIIQPILRPVQESIAQEVNHAVTGVTGLISGLQPATTSVITESIPVPSRVAVSVSSLITDHTENPPSITHNAEVQAEDNIPRPVTERMGSSKLASPAKISHVSSEVATAPKATLQLRVGAGASLSETVQNAGLMSKDFNQPGSAREFYDRVIAPNASKFKTGEFEQLTKALEKADTMGAYYQNNKQLFQNSWMEKLTSQDDVNIGLKTPVSEVVMNDTLPLPKEITVPKGSSLLAELNNTGIFTEKDLSTPGSAKDFYLRFIAQNPQLNAGEKLRFMESSTASFYELASKKPEVYRILSSIKAGAKFQVIVLTLPSADLSEVKSAEAGTKLIDSSQLQDSLVNRDQSGVKWHFVTDGTAGVLRVKLSGGNIKDIVLVPNEPPEISYSQGTNFTRFELMSAVQTMLGYDEKDLNYLLHDLDKDMSSLYAGVHPDAGPLSNLYLKALLMDAFQNEKILPTVDYEKGYMNDLFAKIKATKDVGLLEKINTYSIDQAVSRASMSSSKQLLPKYEHDLRALLDGVKSQSDLIEKLVKDPSVVGMKVGQMPVSENKSANDYLSDFGEKLYLPKEPAPAVPAVSAPGISENALNTPQNTAIESAAVPIVETPPHIPRSVVIERGESLLSALNRAQVFTDTEMKQLNNKGGGKIFFERIIKPNIGKDLVFTDAEGKTLQQLFDNPNATLYGVIYDPKLTRVLTKFSKLLPGQTWVIEPSAEQLHSLELYERRLSAARAFKELADQRRAAQLQSLNEESAPAPALTLDKGPLPIKLPEVPFTAGVFQAYLTSNNLDNPDLSEVQSVLKALTKEQLSPSDIELVRDSAQHRGIDDFGTKLAMHMKDVRADDHKIAQSLKVFIDTNHLAVDIATASPQGIKLLSKIGYSDTDMHRLILTAEGFNPETITAQSGIQRFGEGLYLVRGINNDPEQEIIARLGSAYIQEPSSFEYRAMHVLERITSLPSQSLASIQKNRFYLSFICESIAPKGKEILLEKLIADSKLFGIFPDSEVARLYTEASSGNLEAYHALEKILLKPGEAARYLRSIKPSNDGNVLYQILRPDENPDKGHVLSRIKDYGRYLGLIEYSEVAPEASMSKSGDNTFIAAKIDTDLVTLPQRSAVDLPSELSQTVSLDSIFNNRHDEGVFVEAPDGSVSRLIGTLQETLEIKSYPQSFIDILSKIENTQQTGDEFLKRVVGRNIFTGGLQKFDEVFGSNIAGDRVLGGGSTVDMQLTEMLLGDPYSSEATSMFGRRPDLYGRLDYLNHLISRIRSSDGSSLLDDTSVFKPNTNLTLSDLRGLANRDVLSKLTAKFESFLVSRELQRIYSHDKIIEAYLNHVPLGAAGTLQGGQGRQIFGFQAASRIYFGKSIEQLSSAEQLVLVKIANAPGARSPIAIRQSAGTLHPALNSAILDIESKFLPDAKTDAEKNFWRTQIEVVKQMQFANTIPDDWKLETPQNLPQGTYARLQSLIDGKLARRDVSHISGVGYVMQLDPSLYDVSTRTFGGVKLPGDFVDHKPPDNLGNLIEHKFSQAKSGGYELFTDKGQRIKIPSFTQAYQNESGKWVTTNTIGVGIVAVDVDSMEPVIEYDPSHSILGYAPPASTIKPFIASFLQSKGIDINSVVFPNTPGQYALDGSKLMVHNHSESIDRISRMTLAQALLDSSNVPFQYAMKEYLTSHPDGWNEFQDFMKHFGIPLRDLEGNILQKPSAYSAIGTDVVVNMEDYARAYALLANPDKVFSDPKITQGIRVITDHMTSEKSTQYLSTQNPYPIATRVMNGRPISYFTKSGTESTNSLLNAGFMKTTNGKTFSILTRVVNQDILFNKAGTPYATAGNLVKVLGSNQAWGSRTASPISYVVAETLEKTIKYPEVATATLPPSATYANLPFATPNSTYSIPQAGLLQEFSPTATPTLGTTPFIIYGGRDSNWSTASPIPTATPPIFASQEIDWKKNVNVAATEIVTSLSKLRPDEKPILLGHSFGANAVMTAAYMEIKNNTSNTIGGLVLEDPDFAENPIFSDSIAGLGTISDRTPILLILSKGKTMSEAFLLDHPNITVSYHPTLSHMQLPSDAEVQQKIAEWTLQLKRQ